MKLPFLLYPFTSIDADRIVDALLTDLRSATGSSGYDQIASALLNETTPQVAEARAKVKLERRHGLAGLEEILQNEAATAVIALVSGASALLNAAACKPATSWRKRVTP